VSRTEKHDPVSSTDILGQRKLLALFVPLALSNLLMAVTETMANAGIARLPSPENSLAAFGVVLSIAILIEGPVIMLIQAANALVVDFRSFRMTYWFTISLSLGLTAVHGIIAFTPLFDVVFRDVIGLPPAIAELARPAFALMLPWTPAIGWRRYFQGVLINHGKTSPFVWGTILRVVSLAAVMGVGVAFTRATGVIVGAAAMSISVMVEAALITAATIVLLRDERRDWAVRGWGAVFSWTPRPPAVDGSLKSLTLPELLRFYWPLALTSMAAIVGRPILSAALARSAQPDLSLAAWPVIWATVMLFFGPAQMLQQLVIRYSQPREQLRQVRRFVVSVALVFTAAFGVIALSPMAHWYLESIVGVRGQVLSITADALPLVAVLPVFYVAQNYFYGLLIKRRVTLAVNAGAVANLVGLSSFMFAAVMLTRVTGAYLGVLGLYTGLAVEIGLLRWSSRPRKDTSSAPGRRRGG